VKSGRYVKERSGFLVPDRCGRVPHVRTSVHGPKTIFSNAFTPCVSRISPSATVFCPHSKGLRPNSVVEDGRATYLLSFSPGLEAEPDGVGNRPQRKALARICLRALAVFAN
jgi:hypothetical protein